MQDLLNNSGFVALAGTIFGGAGLKMIEHQLGKAKARSTEAASMREELRKEIDDLRSQVATSKEEERRLESEIARWTRDYYDLRDEKQKITTELSIIKAELERLKALTAKS
jgi:chromosome segregation ATPase